MITKLLNKNYVLLVSGHGISQLGSFIYTTAIILVLKDITDSATLIGLNSTLALIPTALFGILAGTIVDNFNKKYIMVFTDILRGLSMLLLASIAFISISNIRIIQILSFQINLPKIELSYWIILVVSIFVGFNNVIFTPAINSILPDTMPNNSITKGNSFFQTISQITQIIGQPLGGILFAIFGSSMVFFINGISFIISGISEMLISIPSSKKTKNISFKAFIKQTKDGFIYINSVKGLLPLLLILVLTNSLFPPFLLCLPFYVEDFLQLPQSYYGYLLGAIGVGAVIASVIYSIITIPKNKKFLYFLIGFIMISILAFAINIKMNILLLFVLFGLFGFSNMQINIMLNSTFQEKILKEFRGRFWGVVQTVVVIAAPISYLISGIMIDIFNKNVSIIFLIIGIILLLTTFYIGFNRKIKEFYNFNVE